MMKQPSEPLLSSCLLVDLETTQQGKILKIGAALGDQQFLRIGQFDLPAALVELDRFAAGATCVVGHNLIQHDLTVLAEKNPTLALLRLPVIDTLFLSPICFPENPYHRLVKGHGVRPLLVNKQRRQVPLRGAGERGQSWFPPLLSRTRFGIDQTH